MTDITTALERLRKAVELAGWHRLDYVSDDDEQQATEAQNDADLADLATIEDELTRLREETRGLSDQLMWFEWYERLGSSEEKRAMAAFDIATERDEAVAALRAAWAVLGSHPDPESVYNEAARAIGGTLARLSTPKEPTP